MHADFPRCRFCNAELTHTLVDLGATPLANSFVTEADIAAGRDRKFPLHARVCPSCLLVQVDDSVPPDAIFSDYVYFSSYSDSWVRHARHYAEAMTERFALNPESLVVEVASNDGYLLQHFRDRAIQTLGVEPAKNVAASAIAKGIPTEIVFFGQDTAMQLLARGVQADLMTANNVLAHVPNIRDFVAGFRVLLKDTGVATFEFPHVLNLIQQIQFDTIYHEHFSYLSLLTVERVFRACGLRVFDVEQLTTHGGSLRLFACLDNAAHVPTARLAEVRAKESAVGLNKLAGYDGYAQRVEAVKSSFHAFLGQARTEGKRICAYGAAAKGNTFLNVCAVSEHDIACVFDRSLAKQGKRLPGCHIPVIAPERINEMDADYLLILPWNLAGEIRAQVEATADWKGQFIIAVPSIQFV